MKHVIVEECRFVHKENIHDLVGLLPMAEMNMYHCRQKQKPVDKGTSYHFFWFQPLTAKITKKFISRSPHPWNPFSYLRCQRSKKIAHCYKVLVEDGLPGEVSATCASEDSVEVLVAD